jgi:hypothetical protein
LPARRQGRLSVDSVYSRPFSACRSWRFDLGMSIASLLAMTDESYTTLLLWTICVLTFACGVVALTQHPEWFGA